MPSTDMWSRELDMLTWGVRAGDSCVGAMSIWMVAIIPKERVNVGKRGG